MAAEVVGGAFLSAGLQALFDRITSRRVLNFIRRRRIDEEKLRRLKISLLAINVVLDDAEEKQITNHHVRKWLCELKDVVYDAEDLVDEIDYEALRCEMEGKPQTWITQVRNRLSSCNPFNKNEEMELKLEETLERLEYMQKQSRILKLNEGVRQRSQRPLRESSSLVEEAAVYGRDTDKEAVMNSLLSEDSDGKGIGVIPIVGLGGIGKTTLAQLVFNDNKVKEVFEVRAWVCVSEESDVSKITRIMLQEVTSQPHDVQTLNQLQLKLKDQLAKRKFLMVLDDVWNLNHGNWGHLLTPLRSGAKGSRIIVTTRDETIASIVQTLLIYPLTQLLDDSSWQLFMQSAFEDVNFSPPPSIEAIGRKIVRKCGGLPLAVKAIAGVLRSKVDVAEWENILDSKMWIEEEKTVLPALKLSYHHLPSELKRCFAYCALFPKDYKVQKEMLVRLWMAEGFLDHTDENGLEEKGGEYFNDLIARSFFQRIGDDKSRVIMHDLMHDLAEAIYEEYCCRIEADVLRKISDKTRHLLNVTVSDVEKFEGSDKATRLRTFLTINPYEYYFKPSQSKTLAQDMFSKLRFVRVLSMISFKDIQELPSSIDALKLVRYLDLSYSGIKKLPETICTLYKLQNLKLFRCEKLVALPRNLGRLINLCLLDIRHTRVNKMPLFIGRLKKLKTLTTFPLGKQRCSTITELKDLQFLRGTLSILNLQNVVSVGDAVKANLKGKKNLKELILSWNDDGSDSQKERDVLDKLQPHTHLESLFMEHYSGTRFPDWIGDCSFSSLKSLRLEGAKNCLSLPCLGQLPSLQGLYISGFHSVVRVGAEFEGLTSAVGRPFRSLEELTFGNMSVWEEWDSSESDFPRLKKLELIRCPKLRESLPKHLPSLTHIKINKCGQLVAELPRVPALCEMALMYSGELSATEIPWGLDTVQIPNDNAATDSQDELEPHQTSLEYLNACHSFPFTSPFICSLKNVTIRRCKSVRSLQFELLPKLDKIVVWTSKNLETLSRSEGSPVDLTSLRFMEICGCPRLVSFPVGGISAPNLKEFKIDKCRSLKSLPEHMCTLFRSLKFFYISNCEEVESFPERGLPLSLEHLTISGCGKLMHGWRQWDLQRLSSLKSITICGGSQYDLESFPEEHFLPASLKHLWVSDFENLKSVNEQGLQQLTSLENLFLFHCPNLRSLPVHVLPASFRVLDIRNCPLLTKRFEEKNGDYRSRISRVPNVRIDDRFIHEIIE